jgi:hypothetical protein
MQLSGGLYSYNRFDAYEAALEENREAAMSAGESEGKGVMRSAGKPAKVTGGKLRVELGKDGKPLFKEGKDAGSPEKMKKEVDKAGKKAKKGGRYLVDYDEKAEEEEEGNTAGGEASGGAMGEGYKPLPGDKMMRQAHKAYRKEEDAVKRGDGPGATKQMKRRFAMEAPDMRKAALDNKKAKMKKEDVGLNNEETTENVMENRMAMYSRALGVMGAHYSGPGFGVSGIEEKKEVPDFIKDKKKEDDEDEKDETKGGKKADKDYDGDGKVESSKEEYFGSKDKAIKKAMKEGMMPSKKMDKYNDESKLAPGMKSNDFKKSVAKMDTSPMKLTKEDVVEYLVAEGYANNEVSAEILHQHVSDEFLAEIEERMSGQAGS